MGQRAICQHSLNGGDLQLHTTFAVNVHNKACGESAMMLHGSHHSLDGGDLQLHTCFSVDVYDNACGEINITLHGSQHGLREVDLQLPMTTSLLCQVLRYCLNDIN